MTTIYKQTLNPNYPMQSSGVPDGSTFLSAGVQGEDIVVWYRCDPSRAKGPRWFAVVGTGHPMPGDDLEWIFLNTVLLYGGRIVLHVFVTHESAPGPAGVG